MRELGWVEMCCIGRMSGWAVEGEGEREKKRAERNEGQQLASRTLDKEMYRAVTHFVV